MRARTSSTWPSRWSTRKPMKSYRRSTRTIAGKPDRLLPGRRRRSKLAVGHELNLEREAFAMKHHAFIDSVKYLLAAAVFATASLASAQPTFGNPSPTAGRDTSQKANASADQSMYQAVNYTNVGRKGPAVIVIPGEIKSNNATFLQKFTANNIADFGELELGNANFPVLERSNLGPLLKEFELAYNLGDPDQARKMLRMGKLKTTKFVVKFDILKTEQVASAQQGFDGRTLGAMAGMLGGFGRGAAAGGTAVASVHSDEATSVWVIGMRYKIINAETTEQV